MIWCPSLAGVRDADSSFLRHLSFFETPLLRKSTYAASLMFTIANHGPTRKSAILKGRAYALFRFFRSAAFLLLAFAAAFDAFVAVFSKIRRQ